MALLAGPGCDPGTDETKVEKTGVEKANVILAILHSLRKDHVGAYVNDPMRTPGDLCRTTRVAGAVIRAPVTRSAKGHGGGRDHAPL
jgi:hypothetical protein